MPDRDNSKITHALMLALVLIVGAVVRFYNLAAVSVDGFDVWIYMDHARKWNLHAISPTEMYAKFGFIQLCAISSALFSNADYAIPFMNALIDCLNIAAIMAIVRLSGFSFAAAAACSLAYALLPASILLSRDALSHSSTVFFLLCAFISFLVAQHKSRGPALALMALCGFCVSYAVTCHPTMLMFPPIFLALLVMAKCPDGIKATGRICGEALAFVLGGFVPFVYFSFFVPGSASLPQKILALFDSMFSHGALPEYIEETIGISWNKITVFFQGYLFWELLLPLHATLALLAMAAFLLFILRQRRAGRTPGPAAVTRRRHLRNMFFMTAACLLGFILRFNGREQILWGARLFFPLVPLLLMMTYGMLEELLADRSPGAVKPLLLTTGLVCGVATFSIYMPFSFYASPPFYKHVKTIINNQGLTIDNEHRILLVPSKYKPYVAVEYYIPSDYIRSLDAKCLSRTDCIDALVQNNNVKYIVVSRSLTLDDYEFTNAKDKRWLALLDAAKQQTWPEFAAIREYIAARKLPLLYAAGNPDLSLDSLKGFPHIAIGNHALRVHEHDQLGRQDAFAVYLANP